MRILVTGSTGMVGRNILTHANAEEYKFLSPSRKELDLLDRKAVLDFLKSELPDLVIHAAGVVGGIQANMANPVNFLVDNTLMGVNVIDGARKVGIPELVNLASSCIYPREAMNPLKESSILSGKLEPTNEGYALAKITAIRLCEYISYTHEEYNYRTVIPCNLYGKYDKFDPRHSHMIPAVIRKIHEAKASGDREVVIWGDGKARREFMYAEDLADFIYYAILRLKTMPQTLNIGLGLDYSINEYYQIIADVIGFEGYFKHDLTKPVGMRQKLIDTTLLERFGWRYKTSLRDGLQKTYSFFLDDIING